MLNIKLPDQRLEYKSINIIDFIMFKYWYEEKREQGYIHILIKV